MAARSERAVLADLPARAYLDQVGNVDVTASGVLAPGILDMPGTLIDGALINSVDYKLTYDPTSLPALTTGSTVQIRSLIGIPAATGAYIVRETMPVDDGKFSAATLSKV